MGNPLVDSSSTCVPTPTPTCDLALSIQDSPEPLPHHEDDDVTVVTSNCSRDRRSGRDLHAEKSGDPAVNREPQAKLQGNPFALLATADEEPQTEHSGPMMMPRGTSVPWSKANAWQRILARELASKSENALFDVSGIKIAVNLAIADTGATSNFLLVGAPIVNKQVAELPL